MFFFYKLFIFFIVFNLIYSFIRITLYIFCDDFCNNILLENRLLDNNELNLNTNIANTFQKVNFTAFPGQKLTLVIKNSKRYLGIAAKIIVQSNGNYYYYNTKNNYDSFSYNLTDSKSKYDLKCDTNNYYYEICSELEFVICSTDTYSHDNSLIEFYFTIPNGFSNENLYANRKIELILLSDNNLEININEYFSPTIDIEDKYIGIYFSKYNEIDLKGKFYDSSLNEINLETINFDKKILYYTPDDHKDMYNEILYYEFTHGDYFEEDNSKKYINILYCPVYCSYCNIKKICIKTDGTIYFLYNMILNIENTISSNNLDYLTDDYSFLIFALNNRIDFSESNLETTNLNYCINKLKLNTNYAPDYNYIIIAYYNEFKLIEFNAYDQEGRYVVNSNDCILSYSSSYYSSYSSSIQLSSSSSSYFDFSSSSSKTIDDYYSSSSHLSYSSSYSYSYSSSYYSYSYSSSSYSSSFSSFSSSSSYELPLCYEHCLTCIGKNYNECTSCEPSYTLTSIKSCVNLSEKCGNTSKLWYFYLDNAEIKCLPGFKCQNESVKYISETLECIPNCENYYFSNKYTCVNCEDENHVQIYDSCVNKYEINEITTIISKYILDFINQTFSEGNSTYQIGNYPLIEQINLTNINLGDCENKLKTYYKTDSLIILICDTIDETSITNSVKFNVYNLEGTLLDLSICDDDDISIITPIKNTSNINYDMAKILNDYGIDLYNINDNFYTDFCNNQNISDQDLTLDDRIEDIYVEVNFCGKCKYNGINYSTQKVICLCSPFEDDSSSMNYEKENLNSTKNDFWEKINDNINYKIIKCYRYFLSFKYFKKNLGFYFAFIFSFLCFIFFIIYLNSWYVNTKKIIDEELNKYEFEKNKKEKNFYKKLYEDKKKSAMKFLASVNNITKENKFINNDNDSKNNNDNFLIENSPKNKNNNKNFSNKNSNLNDNLNNINNLKPNNSFSSFSSKLKFNKINLNSNDIINKPSELQTNSLNNETEEIKLVKNNNNFEEDDDIINKNNNIIETDFFKNYFARLSNKTLAKIKKNKNSNPPKKNLINYYAGNNNNNIKSKKPIKKHTRINSSNFDLMMSSNLNIKNINNKNIVIAPQYKKNNKINKIDDKKENINQISKENSFSNHEIKEQNNIKSDKIELIKIDNNDNNKNEEKNEKNSNLDDTYNNYVEENFTEKNINLNNNNKLQASKTINNNELNELTFKQSEKLDKRNLFLLSFSFITNKINIIKIICYSELYQYIPLLLSTYLFGILLDFTLNAFLYSDDIISKKYKNNGNLDFWTNEFLSMISKLIGFIISGIVVNLTEYSINLNFFVEEVKGNKKYYGKLLEYLKKINRKIIIFYIIENLFNLFFIYYLEVFCAIYQKSQIALFKTYLIGELTGFLYTLLIGIIIALLRFISLRCSKKRIFIISQYIDKKTS